MDDPCVYTTQHGPWLRAAVGCSRPVCFRSGKRWKKAHQLLTSHPTLPVLFREQDDETTPFWPAASSLNSSRFISSISSRTTAPAVLGLRIDCGCSVTR